MEFTMNTSISSLIAFTAGRRKPSGPPRDLNRWESLKKTFWRGSSNMCACADFWDWSVSRTIEWPKRSTAVESNREGVGFVVLEYNLYLGNLKELMAGKYSFQTMYWYCAMFTIRAAWNKRSSDHFGKQRLISSARRSCSRENSVCNEVSIGCSLARESPDMKCKLVLLPGAFGPTSACSSEYIGRRPPGECLSFPPRKALRALDLCTVDP